MTDSEPSSAVLAGSAGTGGAPAAPTDPSQRTLQDGAAAEFERMLDDKGRVTIPPRLRNQLGTDYVTARGPVGTVLAIPAELWPEVEGRLRDNVESGDRYLQFAIHNHTRTSLDRQGRLKLPKHLLEWAGITPGDAVAIIANGQKFEVRNKRTWMQMLREEGREAVAPAPRQQDGPGKNGQGQ